MRKINFLFLLVLFLLFSRCAKWEVLTPTDEEITLRLLGVELTLILDEGKCEIFNPNWGSAHVKISRRADSWGNYLELINCWVNGRSSRTEKIFVSHGDKLELYVSVQNWSSYTDDPEKWSYFQLGKSVERDTTIIITIP